MPVAFRSAAQAQNDSGTTLVITAPAGIVDGDILIAFLASNLSNTDWTHPAGFTETFDSQHVAGSNRSAVSWKLASGESGNYTFTSTGSVDHAGAILVFSGAVSTGPEDTQGTEVTDAAAAYDFLCPAATTTRANAMVIRAVLTGGNGSLTSVAPPTGYTERADIAGDAAGENMAAVYTIDTLQADAGSTGTINIVATGTGTMRGFAVTVALSPPVAAVSGGGLGVSGYTAGSGYFGRMNR